MFKHVESNFVRMHYASYERIVAVPGSTIEIISRLAAENCKNSNLIVIKSGVNNILSDYSVSNCLYLMKKAFNAVLECCPVAHVAFVDVSLVAENTTTGVNFSRDINPKIRELNDSLHTFCEQNDRAHFIDLKPYLCSNNSENIDRDNLCADGLHYSSKGNTKVARALIIEVEALKQAIINDCNRETKFCLSMSNHAGSNLDILWPPLPEPALTSRIHPASFPGQQYIDVNRCAEKTVHAVETQLKTKSVMASDQSRSKVRQNQMLKPFQLKSQYVVKKPYLKPPRNYSRVISKRGTSSHGRDDPVLSPNRFSVLEHEECPVDDSDKQKPQQRNGDTPNFASGFYGNFRKSVKTRARRYRTDIPSAGISKPNVAEEKKECDSPLFKNPYRVSMFSMLSYAKSGFILKDECLNTTVNKHSNRLLFLFQIVPLFLQSLNLTVANPLVQKLLSTYGVKISDGVKSFQTEVSSQPGNLLNFILKLLLNKTRPSNATFLRIYKETGAWLLNYDALFGDRFEIHVKENEVDRLSRNNFDIYLLLLCGDIEKNPGPKRKAGYVKRAQQVLANNPQLKANDSNSGSNPSDMGRNTSHYTINSSITGNFQQGDSSRFGPDSIGKQCACNALISLCDLPLASNVSPSSLDNILIRGDQLYCNMQH